MPVSRKQAKQLCTASEYALVEESFAPPVNALSQADLKDRIKRLRNLRDKFRDLEQRQALEAKGTRRPSGSRPAQGHGGTSAKVAIFQETLARFEKRLAALEEREVKKAQKAAEQEAKRQAKKASDTASRKGKPNPNGSQGRPGGAIPREQTARAHSIHSHGRASSQRNQARRDSR